jgi:hypothetical protein
MKLLKFPYVLLVHLFFIVSIVLHIFSLLHHDFDHETKLSHILQLLSYAAGWILVSFNSKHRKYLFPFAVVFPWTEHIRLLFQFFHNPAVLSFWICMLVAILLPLLSILLFKTSEEQ